MANAIRAKMRCTKSTSEHGQHQVELQAVYGGSEENRSFFEATPSGSVALAVVRPDVGQRFVAGQEYYVDFTPA